MEEYGPVQIMVVGFEKPDFQGAVLDELRALREMDVIRLVDLVVVAKSEDDDTVVSVELSDLTPEESAELGALTGALIGFGAAGEEGAEAGAVAGAEAAVGGMLGDETAWSIGDVIPPGTTAAVALIEHRWAIPLRDAILRAGGFPLADTWIHPQDLVAYGAAVGASSAE